MKSKIEKLKRVENIKEFLDNHQEDINPWLLKDKLNEIIDFINSQSQPEEKKIEDMYAHLTVNDNKSSSKEKVIAEVGSTLKDTPEEWEENLGEIIDNIDIKETPSKGDWLDREYKSALKDVVVCFIRQLLEDREREVVERFYEIVCKHNEYIGDDYATYLGNPTVLLGELYEAILLSKLNNKKK